MKRVLPLIAVLLGTSALADNMTFQRGSLIIPMTSTWQTQCGQISAYGLVYRILQANGPGHRNANSPVTVYMANNTSKGSVNRCKPTNNVVYDSLVPYLTDNKWNDGCDFSITNANEKPVVRVDYTAGSFPTLPAVFNGSTGTSNDLNDYTAYDDAAWPRFLTLPAINKRHSGAINVQTITDLTTVSYGGAPFVIDASDAQKVFDLLKTGDTGTSAFPSQAFSIFKQTCTCSGLDDSTATSGGVTYPSGCHYVDMHQSTIAFTANVDRRINTPPRPFALFDPGYGSGTGDCGSSGNSCTGTGSRGGASSHVLEAYLKISGLWLQGTSNGNDSMGCPVGNVSACTANGSTSAGWGNNASATQAKHGVIFDRFTIADMAYKAGSYPAGILNQKDAGGKLIYNLFWAPHWEASKTGGNCGSGSNCDDSTSMTTVKAYVDNGGNAMAECASIISFENTVNTVLPPNLLYTSGIDYIDSVNTDASNMAVKNSGRSTITGLTPPIKSLSTLPNCSDPALIAPAKCVSWGLPGNIFSQVGDWIWQRPANGTEMAARPDTVAGSGRRVFNGRMLAVQTSTGGLASSDFDMFSMGQESAAKGVIVYVGGHDVSDQPVGSRIILNSMLNLSGVPITSERALAAPTIAYTNAADSGSSYVGTPVFPDVAITPTFDAVSGYSSNSAVKTFSSLNVSETRLFTWPYYPGHLRAQSLSALNTGAQGFASNAQLYDTATLNTPTGISPDPIKRNIFTWVGGYPAAVAGLDGGAPARNNVMQVGWVPESIDGTLLDVDTNTDNDAGTCLKTPAQTGCVDVMGYDSRVTSPLYDGLESGLHLVRGSDGLCDVQEMLNYSSINSGADWGDSSNCNPSNIKKFVRDSKPAAVLLQRVRGFCFTGKDNGDIPKYDPTNVNDCTDNNDNRAHLGGLVHSSAAILTPSSLITDVGGRRPTVAFVGGYDGQLHAFYIGGGKNYTGPLKATWNEDNNPSAVFETTWNFSTPPAAGTELWSFLPASQLPWLKSNSAWVDSSPTILDVFADFAGTGVREWHSVLMVSIGRMGTEVIAIDVTNPLKPRILWDNAGSLFTAGSYPMVSPVMLMSDKNGTLPGANVSRVYRMSGNNPSFSESERSDGGSPRKAYDVRDIGGASGLSSSQIRVGLEPAYVVYATTNVTTERGVSGLVVTALEASTGQMMWQWERLYDITQRPSDNAVPPVATVLSGGDGAARVIVGDMEGRVWELDAATGRNMNTSTSSTFGCTPAAPCQYPLFDTGSSYSNPQPISTNIAVARVPAGLDAGTLASFAGERVLLIGTAGADWIPSTDAGVSGNMHVLLYETNRRVPTSTISGKDVTTGNAWTASAAKAKVESTGVLQEPTGYPKVFAPNERVYGNITISGQVAYFSTATDRISDVMAVAASGTGATYTLDLGQPAASATQAFAGTKAAYGGVAVYVNQQTGAVIGSLTNEMGNINYVKPTGSVLANSAKNAQNKVGMNQGFTYRLMSWLRRVLQ